VNRIKAIFVGVFLGCLIGLTSTTLLTVISALLLGHAIADLNQTIGIILILVRFSIVDTAIVGALGGAMKDAPAVMEYGVFRVLMSVAFASVYIMGVGFESGSILPIVIYGLAILYGIIIAPIVVNVIRKRKYIDDARLAA
jgi:hypothetical protein